MKKRIIIALAGIMALSMAAIPSPVSFGNTPRIVNTVSAAEKGTKDKKKKPDTSIDISSEDDINRFLKGDWRLIDPVTTESFGTFTMDGIGGCSFKADSAKKAVKGEFYVYQKEIYNADKNTYDQTREYSNFTVWFNDIPHEYILPAKYPWDPMDSEMSGGNFFIARGNGYDYLYLRWQGNGDSFIFENIFQNKERLTEEYEANEITDPQDTWIFVRENDGLSDMNKKKNADFYALLWQTEEDNRYFLQTLDPVMSDMEEDYSGRKFKGGYFLEQDDIGIVEYNMSFECDETLVLDTCRLHEAYPGKIYHVQTDKDGWISVFEDVNESYFGTYDFGNLKQEFSHDGTSFTVNGYTTELKDLETPANAVLDMYQVGDYIVTECHVNPHYSMYYITDIYSNMIVNEIGGANLTWVDDDLTTAVYSVWDTLYNYEGNEIGTVDGDEIDEVKLKASGKKIKVTDFDGNRYTFDNPFPDRAMYRYAEFLNHPTAEKWNAFMKLAPKDALAFVLQTPPEDILRMLPYVEPNDDEFPEYVYVTALDNGTDIRFDQGEIDFDTEDYEFIPESTIKEENRNRSEVSGYSMVIPEGPPSVCVYASTWDKGGALPIAWLSGMESRYSVFINNTMTPKEIEEIRPKVSQKTTRSSKEFDLYEAYEDILTEYKEIQEAGYSQEELDKMEFYSGLTQQGWPSGTAKDAVTYQVMDINGDDIVELLISYYGSVIDIYALNTLNPDGPTAELAYSCPYRGMITIYGDGYIEELFSGTASSGSVTWYKLDPEMGQFFPVCEAVYSPTKKDPDHHDYHSLSYSDKDDAERIKKLYKQNGLIPTWAWEINGELTEKEYQSMGSKTSAVKILDVLKLSDFTELGVG